MKNKNTFATVCVLIFITLFVIPLVIVLTSGFGYLKEILQSAYYRKILFFSFFQASFSALISGLLGMPGAYYLANCSFKFKRFVRSVFAIPFVLPSVLAVLGFVIFYGNSGLLNSFFKTEFKILYSFKAVIMAHVFFNTPLFISLVSRAWEKIDYNTIEQARTDGAGSFSIITKITFPTLLPSVLSSLLLIFLFCFTSFAIILVLGKGPSMTTSEVEIYRLARTTMQVGKACALSIVSIVIALTVILADNFVNNHKDTPVQTSFSDYPKKKLPIIGKIYIFLVCIYIMSPVLSIMYRSVFSSNTRSSSLLFSLKAYAELDWFCILKTLFIATSASFISVFTALGLCTFLKKRKNVLIGGILMLPMAVSSVILGLAYYIISQYLSFIPSFVLIVLIHSILILPFALKSIMPVYFGLSEEISDSARVEGASENQIMLKIIIPQLRGSLITAFIFSFTLSCGELNSTLTFSNGEMVTIPVQIFRMINSYNWQGACALGTVLCLISFVLFMLSERDKLSHKQAF